MPLRGDAALGGNHYVDLVVRLDAAVRRQLGGDRALAGLAVAGNVVAGEDDAAHDAAQDIVGAVRAPAGVRRLAAGHDTDELGPEYHVVAVYDAAADQMRLYIDGALADTASLGGGNIMQLNANEAYFGAAVNYPDPNLNGAINEIRIWRTPLNATLVASQFAAGPDNLVNYSPVVTLNISLIGGVPTITWPFGVLEEADSLKGPWTSLVEATSPYTPAAAALQKFYRVKVN